MKEGRAEKGGRKEEKRRVEEGRKGEEKGRGGDAAVRGTQRAATSIGSARVCIRACERAFVCVV